MPDASLIPKRAHLVLQGRRDEGLTTLRRLEPVRREKDGTSVRLRVSRWASSTFDSAINGGRKIRTFPLEDGEGGESGVSGDR